MEGVAFFVFGLVIGVIFMFVGITTKNASRRV